MPPVPPKTAGFCAFFAGAPAARRIPALIMRGGYALLHAQVVEKVYKRLHGLEHLGILRDLKVVQDRCLKVEWMMRDRSSA